MFNIKIKYFQKLISKVQDLTFTQYDRHRPNSDKPDRDGRFGPKVGQIGPKWDKSGAFSDQISVHLARWRQMH